MSKRYYEYRLDLIRKSINHLLTMLSLTRAEIEALPLSDYQDIEMGNKMLLYRASKPTQIDGP